MTDERTRPKHVRLTGLQEAQLSALVALDRACAAMYYEIGFDAAEIPTRTTADIGNLPRQHNVKVAEADHEVAGYLAWRDESPGVAYIEELSVHPDFQRFGVGTQLLEGLREEARGLKIQDVVVKCWTKATWARTFYEACGFKPIDASAPAKVQHWHDERSSVHPLTRPGEIAMWAPVGAASAKPDEPDESDIDDPETPVGLGE